MLGISEKQLAGQYGTMRGNKRPDHIKEYGFYSELHGEPLKGFQRGVK